MSKISKLLNSISGNLNSDSLVETYSIPTDIMKQKKSELSAFQKSILELETHYRKFARPDLGQNEDFYKKVDAFLNKAKASKGFTNLPLNILSSFFDLVQEINADYQFYTDPTSNPMATKDKIESYLDLIGDYSNELL